MNHSIISNYRQIDENDALISRGKKAVSKYNTIELKNQKRDESENFDKWSQSKKNDRADSSDKSKIIQKSQ